MVEEYWRLLLRGWESILPGVERSNLYYFCSACLDYAVGDEGGAERRAWKVTFFWVSILLLFIRSCVMINIVD